MKRLTYSRLNKELAKYGVQVKGDSSTFDYGCGCIPLYDIESDDHLTTVYVNRINHLTLEGWIDVAKGAKDKYKHEKNSR